MVEWLIGGKRYSCIRYPLNVKWLNVLMGKIFVCAAGNHGMRDGLLSC